MNRRVGLREYMLILLVVLCVSTQCTKLPDTQTVTPIDHTNTLLPTEIPVLKVTPTKQPNPTPAPISSELVTSTPLIEQLSNSPTFTYTLFDDRWLSQFDEQYIYILTASDSMLDVSSGIRTIWRFSLQDGSYEKLASWSLAEAEDLTTRLTDELEAKFCSRYHIAPQDLPALKVWFDPQDIQLSPDGRYLAIGATSWVYDLELAPLESHAILLDVDTKTLLHIPTSLTAASYERWGKFRWSPDGSKLALTWLSKHSGNTLFLYDLSSSSLTQVGEEYEAVWVEDSNHLILQNNSLGNNGDLLMLDTTNQLTHTLAISFTRQLIGSKTGKIWSVYAGDGLTLNLSEFDSEAREFNYIARADGLHMISPEGNAAGSLLAFERTPTYREWFFQVFDMKNQEPYTILESSVYTWEWSQVTDSVLVSFLDEHQTHQVGIVQVRGGVIVVLPPLPDPNWIIDVTW